MVSRDRFLRVQSLTSLACRSMFKTSKVLIARFLAIFFFFCSGIMSSSLGNKQKLHSFSAKCSSLKNHSMNYEH